MARQLVDQLLGRVARGQADQDVARRAQGRAQIAATDVGDGDPAAVLRLRRQVGGDRCRPVPGDHVVPAARQAARHPGPDPPQSHDRDLHGCSFDTDDDRSRDRAAHGLGDKVGHPGQARRPASLACRRRTRRPPCWRAARSPAACAAIRVPNDSIRPRDGQVPLRVRGHHQEDSRCPARPCAAARSNGGSADRCRTVVAAPSPSRTARRMRSSWTKTSASGGR